VARGRDSDEILATGGTMKKPRSWALGVVFLIAVALLVLPAFVLTGQSSSTPVRIEKTKAESARSAENVRADRRESFRHRGCSKRPDAFRASV
jgi:hypothetical protein